MKGMIFTEFLDMVSDRFGLAVKDRVIAAAGGAHDGAYTAVGKYDYREMVAMIGELNRATGIAVPALMNSFGEHVFQGFTRRYGHLFRETTSAITFLSHLEDYIHVEMRKLYPDAELPSFRYPPAAPGTLVMEYHSPRPMAAFAEGLVRATIRYFGKPLSLSVEDLSAGQGTAARFTLGPST
jgi:Haem-NO-binding